MGAPMTFRAIPLLLVASLLAACQVGTAAEQPAPAAPTSTARAVAVAPIATDTAPATAATPPPAEGPIPTVRPTLASTPAPPTPPPPPPAPFALSLYEEGDFVPQYTFDWCVGASIQMAHNLIVAERRTSRDDQEALWERARGHSVNSFNGANPLGWAAVLNDIGLGPYEVVSIADYDEALRTAAAAMRDTQRPVGLVMWRGRHAWVMSGFESMGDPAIHADFTVTGVRVLDPLFPHGSSIWGPSPEPNSLLSPAQLANDFVIRESRRWSSHMPSGYLLVLPTLP